MNEKLNKLICKIYTPNKNGKVTLLRILDETITTTLVYGFVLFIVSLLLGIIGKIGNVDGIPKMFGKYTSDWFMPLHGLVYLIIVVIICVFILLIIVCIICIIETFINWAKNIDVATCELQKFKIVTETDKSKIIEIDNKQYRIPKDAQLRK